uniref:Tissue factor n=1 Tax=Poecilia latipinna TaxID=48699 RepID=A0A3B3U6V9_9TELE
TSICCSFNKLHLLALLLINTYIQNTTQDIWGAANVTWSSTNFKTVLSWGPQPSADYSYTVEFFVAGGDRKRNLHCIRSNATMCDLSISLTELKSCYSADILSKPPLGTTSDDNEFPHTTSPLFCPYRETASGCLEEQSDETWRQKRLHVCSDCPCQVTLSLLDHRRRKFEIPCLCGCSISDQSCLMRRLEFYTLLL